MPVITNEDAFSFNLLRCTETDTTYTRTMNARGVHTVIFEHSNSMEQFISI